jgi:hypothetical protein
MLADMVSRAKEVFAGSRIFDLRCLAVEQDGEAIVLRGRVDSFYHKQLAQELLKVQIDGVEVINAIQVDYNRERRDEAPAARSTGAFGHRPVR